MSIPSEACASIQWSSRWRMACERACKTVRITVGLLLVTAAALKAYDRFTSAPTEPTIFWGTPWFQFLVIELELAVGIWLLLGVHQDLARLGALICFSAFAAVSGLQAWYREPTCHCFGRFSVDPKHVLILDVLVLAALAFCRPVVSPVANRIDSM
jgi:uncharacterized membrane protein YphA (DoxX/SURF4 family)